MASALGLDLDSCGMLQWVHERTSEAESQALGLIRE